MQFGLGSILYYVNVCHKYVLFFRSGPCRYFQVPRRLLDLAEEQLQLSGAAVRAAAAIVCW